MSDDRQTINGALVDWRCSGEFRFTTGFGATKAENAIANYAAFLAPVVLYFLSWQELDWSITQYVVAAILAIDMVGGVLTNSLGSMKRFLYSDGQPSLSWLARLVQSKFLFPLIHIQIFVVPLCFDVAWSYGFFWWGAMMAAIVLIHALPLYLHRPVALLVVMLSIMVNQGAFSPVAGFEWMAPIYMIKLLLSHAVREEPYRPESAL